MDPTMTNAEKQAVRREGDRERHRLVRREWYHKNLEKSREYRRRWYANNREKLIAKPASEKTLALWRNKAAKKRATVGAHTAQDIEEIHRSQKFKCAVCQKSTRRKFHVDHITPLSRGGSNNRSNLQILCPFCNMSKGPKDAATFMRSRGFLL